MRIASLSSAAAGIFVSSAILAGCSVPLPTTATEVQVAPERVTVVRGSIENHIVANGHVVADRTATLSFSRVGRIALVNTREGEWVKQGQLLARLDTRELEFIVKQQKAAYISALAQYSQTVRGGSSFDIQQAQSELASANQRLKDLNTGPTQAQVTELQALVQQAEAELKRAQADYDNAFREDPSTITASPAAAALELKTIATQAAKARLAAVYEKPKAGQFAELRSQAAAAQARLNALKPVTESIISSEAVADQAYYSWQLSEQTLRDTRIVAPFDGLVTNVAMSAGDMTSGSSVIEIADFNEPLFEANVDEADIAKIEVGQPARVRLQSYIDTPFDAEVKSISKIGQPNGSLIVYRVRLVIGPAGQSPDEGGAEPSAEAGASPSAETNAEQDTASTAGSSADENAAQSTGSSADQGADPAEEQSAEPQTQVMLNMSGIAQFITASSEDALLLPANAVIHNPEENTYVVQMVTTENGKEKISEVEIEPGLRNSDMIEVINGVKEGDVLIVPEPDNVPLEGPSVN